MNELIWTEDLVAALGPDEHDFQEFKGSGWLVQGAEIAPEFHVALSKQVSAFANGAGGRVVIGVDDTGRIDGGVPVDFRKGGVRSWLEDVVPGLVDPPLASFNVYEVLPSSEASSIRAGHAVYVLEIPSSDAAPHQALDHRYYLRIAGKSRPMGHVHVTDILRRTHVPRVELRRLAPFGPEERVTTDPRGPKVLVSFRAYVENLGRTLAHHVGAEIVVPRPLVNREARQRTLATGASLTQRPGTVNFFRYHPNPIFPGQDLTFVQFWVAVHTSNMDAIAGGMTRLAWRVYADDAPFREGSVGLMEYTVVREAIAWLRAARRG
jgi:hypothetical protein